MPTMHIPDEWQLKIIELGKMNWKRYVREAVKKQLKEDGVNVE